MLIPLMRSDSEFDSVTVDDRHAIHRIHAMTQQEQHYRVWESEGDDRESISLYITSGFATTTEQHVDSQSRKLMCNWCYQVVDYFKFSRETVQIGMSYFDRFLITPQGRPCIADRSHFQLACITCMYVAIKVNEQMDLHASLLCQLSRGSYTVSQITHMEKVILESLQWRLNPPTATAFVQHIIALLPSSFSPNDRSRLLNVALYQAELALFDHRLVRANAASTIAAAAVSNAVESIGSLECPLSLKGAFMKNVHRVIGSLPGIDDLRDCQTQLLRCFTESIEKSTSASCSETLLVLEKGAFKRLEGKENFPLSVSP